MAMKDAVNRRDRTRARMTRGEQRREGNPSQELRGAFTHSGGEVGRRRKILGIHAFVNATGSSLPCLCRLFVRN
jgi:hypothetical protein